MENDGIAHLTFSALRPCRQDLRRYDKSARHGQLPSIQTTRQAVVADSQPWLEKAAHGRRVGSSKLLASAGFDGELGFWLPAQPTLFVEEPWTNLHNNLRSKRLVKNEKDNQNLRPWRKDVARPQASSCLGNQIRICARNFLCKLSSGNLALTHCRYREKARSFLSKFSGADEERFSPL